MTSRASVSKVVSHLSISAATEAKAATVSSYPFSLSPLSPSTSTLRPASATPTPFFVATPQARTVTSRGSEDDGLVRLLLSQMPLLTIYLTDETVRMGLPSRNVTTLSGLHIKNFLVVLGAPLLGSSSVTGNYLRLTLHPRTRTSQCSTAPRSKSHSRPSPPTPPRWARAYCCTRL